MSDTVKLIIEIPADVYKKVHEHKLCIITTKQDDQEIVIGVRKGIPFDNVKAEIKKKCDRINTIVKSIASVLSYPQHREIQELLCEILTSIDNAESEK